VERPWRLGCPSPHWTGFRHLCVQLPQGLDGSVVWLAQPLGIVERLLGVLIPRGCSVLERLLRLEGPKPDVPQNCLGAAQLFTRHGWA
jgi:hypothetical protein